MLAIQRDGVADAGRGVPHALAALTRKLSIEIVPREILAGAKAIDAIPLGTRAFIPRLPKGSFEQSLEVAKALHRRGLKPVPHVTARTTENAATLERQLARYVSEASVEEILLIAGSDSKPVGVYADTLPILESGIVEGSGLSGLYVAGHPEGHPDADDEALKRALAVKNEFAARTGLPVRIVSQFFFDATPVIAWEKRIRAQGNVLPVVPGLHGCTGISSLIRHAIACGVGASLRALTAKGVGILQIAQVQAPDDLACDIAAAYADDPRSHFRGFHMFPLGGLARTIEWSQSLRDGKYSINAAGRLTVSC